MASLRNRHTETLVYGVLWLIVAGLYILGSMSRRSQLSEPLMDLGVVTGMIGALLPFMVLFLVNNYVLIPRFLLTNRLGLYFGMTALLVSVIWAGQYVIFMNELAALPRDARNFPHPPDPAFVPLPVALKFVYALLTTGSNIAIALMFQRFDDKLERESLMKANAESRLASLKAQINPHFYMNMLNNIHGMIEIDPERAQAMVIDMSQLMRYMLYESSRPLVSLSDEVAFLRNYMGLMSQRYPQDRVAVTADFPDEASMRGVMIPPLLTLVFVENAFKHGVSYRDKSFVKVKITLIEAKLCFRCENSNHSHIRSADNISGGIGLKNIRSRLRLIYGDNSSLEITDAEGLYRVNLTIPSHCNHDTQNADNR